MPESPLDAYLETIRPDAHDAVRTLASTVEAADVPFDRRFTYRMLVYTLGGRWHEWVVAIGVSKATVNLRFLYADRLDDSAGLVRMGSSTAGSIDYATDDEIDGDMVTTYVREAVAKHPR